MIIDDKIRDKKSYSVILAEKQQKYLHYHQVKLISMKKYYLLIKVE